MPSDDAAGGAKRHMPIPKKTLCVFFVCAGQRGKNYEEIIRCNHPDDGGSV